MNAFAIVSLGMMIIAIVIPVGMWFLSDRIPKSELDPKDFKRAVALPFLTDGEIPEEKNKTVDEDIHGLREVIVLLFRSWPFVRPYFLGRWYTRSHGTSQEVADPLAGGGYGLIYAPVLATAIAILGPLLGLINIEFGTAESILYLFVASMVLSMWLLALGKLSGVRQSAVAIFLALCTFFTLLLCILVLDGTGPIIYGILLTLSCGLGWVVQFRIESGRLVTRYRLHSHLTYLYLLAAVQGLVTLPLGIIIADLLSMSLLQSEPLQQEVATSLWFGAPEMGAENTESLSVEQRHDLKWSWVYLSLALWAFNLPIGMIVPYYTVWIMQQINQNMRIALVRRWHQLPLSYHSGHRTGDSIFRIYADSAQVNAVIGRLVELSLSLWYYVYALFLLSFLSPTMGAIALSLVIPTIFWARWAMPRMRIRSLVYRATTSDLTSRIQESFAALKLIKAYDAGDRIQEGMERDSVIAMNAAFQSRRLVALLMIIMFVIASIFLLSGEFFMGYSANQGNETYANELIALMAVSWVVWNLGAFQWARTQFHTTSNNVRLFMRLWLTAQDMAMGLSRVFDILDIEPDIEDEPDAVPFIKPEREISFENINFEYESGVPVLEGVSFAAKPGTITAIIGPTGSGKTTMMSLLLRLYEPSSGSIKIDDTLLTKFQISSLREKIAIALQENVLFSLSVRDNIRYVAPEADDSAINQAIEIACMDEYVHNLPQGLDTVLSDRGGKLSTGQRQRLSIARAVVRNTPILILDEPTAALDAVTEQQVMRNLSMWGRDRVIFLITHRISTIRRADNILYLDNGVIIENGTHEELMRTENGRYKSFVDAESNLSGKESGEETE